MKKPLIPVPVNGDAKAQIDFEEELGLVKYVDFSPYRIDLVKTLKTNRLHQNLNRSDTIFANGPHGIGDRLYDHFYMAQTKNGKKYFIAEPYIGKPAKENFHYMYEEVVAEVARWCRENDLHLEVRLNGPHCIDSPTTMFIISGLEVEE